MSPERSKAAVAWLSVASNTTLVMFKLIVGLIIGSVSVLSEAIHSGVDLLAAVIALVAVKTSSKPADQDHRYGHGKIENVSGAVEAALIFLAAGWIIWEAVHKLLSRQAVEEVGLGVLVMAVSAAANYGVSHLLFRVGKKTESIALQADAWHLRTDVWTSVGVMVGLAVIWLGQRVLPGVSLWWLDPVVAIGVALLIIKAAYDLTAGSLHDVLDGSLPPEEEQWILEQFRLPEVRGVHNVRTRKAGAHRFVEAHMVVERTLTVEESHALTDRIVAVIRGRFPESTTTLHVEPCDLQCKPKCQSGCFVPEETRAARRGEQQVSPRPGT